MYYNIATSNDGVANGCAFQWKIENISQCCWLKMKDDIESPVFSADALEGIKWSLLLRPKEDENYVGFFLHRKGSNEPNIIEVNYKLAFLGKDGSVLTEKFQNHGFRSFNTLGAEKFESRERIFFTEREEFLPEDALTVQCTLWKKGERLVKLKHLYARTVFKVNRRSLVWRIEDFGTKKPCLRNKLKDNSIDLDLGLGKKLSINMISFDANIKYMSFNTSIIDSEGKKKNLGISKYFADNLKRGTLSRVNLIHEVLMSNKSLYLPNDVLSLDFECVYSTETKSNEFFDCIMFPPKLTKELVKNGKEYYVGKEESQNSAVLIDDLKSMYTDGIFSDMELRTSKGIFPAHKSILSARSPVFRRMFSNDMKESISGHVDITDLDDDTVRQMLLYIYTDILEDLQFESACKLYAAADKYELMFLKSKCSSFLKDNLCPAKSCAVLILADRHQDDNLKSAVQTYILLHNEVFSLIEWKHVMENNLELAADIMYRKVNPGPGPESGIDESAIIQEGSYSQASSFPEDMEMPAVGQKHGATVAAEGAPAEKRAGLTLPRTGENAARAVMQVPRPSLSLHTEFRTFKKVHRFFTYGLCYNAIQTTYRNKNPTADGKGATDSTDPQYLMSTPLAKIPWDWDLFYLNKSEFSLLPKGAECVKCSVKVFSTDDRITNSPLAKLALFNQNRFIRVAQALAQNVPGVDVIYKKFSDDQPMKPIEVETFKKEHVEYLAKRLYGVVWDSNSTPATYKANIPASQMGFPVQLNNYYCLCYDRRFGHGWPELQSYCDEFNADNCAGKLVTEMHYEPQCGILKTPPHSLFTGFHLQVKDKTVPLDRQDTIAALDYGNLIEKSQSHCRGLYQSFRPKTQPTLHIGVQPVPSVTTAQLTTGIIDSWSNCQASFLVEAEMTVKCEHST